MKARVKANNEVVDVRPERDGYFVDDENNNVYKFDDLDFTYKEEDPFQDPFTSMLNGFLNPTKDMQKDFKEQFYVKTFVEVFFDFFELMQQAYDYPDRAFDESMRFTKKLLNEIKKEKKIIELFCLQFKNYPYLCSENKIECITQKKT